MKLKLTGLILSLLLVIASNTFAQNYALGLKLGTRGAGLDITRSFGNELNIGAGFAYMALTIEGGGLPEDYTYEAETNLFSFTLLADWFPITGSEFRLAGGVVINLNDVTAIATPTKTYQVGGDVYGPEELGTVDIIMEFNKVAPYFGIGFGNPTSGESGINWSIDVGTFYQGATAVDLKAEGLLSPSAAPDQEELIEDNISWFKWYPVIVLGLNYKF